MKKTLILLILVLAIAAIPSDIFATTRNELKYLEYSDMMLSEFDGVFPEETSEQEEVPVEQNDVDSLHEQLRELASTRSIVSDKKSQSAVIRYKIEQYWNKILPKQTSQDVPMAIKQQIVANMRTDLNKAGYTITYLKILNLPVNNQEYKVRAVVRAHRKLKSKNSYKEIQNNLKELNQICQKAATIGNHMFLSELTTFIAENPKNKYYYEKTILNNGK